MTTGSYRPTPSTDDACTLAAQLRALVRDGAIWPPALVPEMERLADELDAVAAETECAGKAA